MKIVTYKGQECPVLETQEVWGKEMILLIFTTMTPTLASKPIKTDKKIWVEANLTKPFILRGKSDKN